VFYRTNYSLLKTKLTNVMVECLALSFHVSELKVTNNPKMCKRTFAIIFSPSNCWDSILAI